ncbi:HD family phosphohydrolase [Bacillus sp. 2205SS5-2]|uniref:HD family phosphohydrolase n=1 Tax=Bacillus sp. 2205SS5-2 TaxID=3109031 RepID=UPI0030072A63
MNQLLVKIKELISFKVFTGIIFLFLGFILYGLLISNVQTETYNLELFEVAKETIYSPTTKEDEEKTEQLKQKAAEEVEPVYEYSPDVKENRKSLITSVFDMILQIQQESNFSSPQLEEPEQNEEVKPLTPKERLNKLKSRLTKDANENVTLSISDQVFESLLVAEKEEILSAQRIVVDEIEKVMAKKIRDEGVPQVKDEIESNIELNNLSQPVKESSIAIGRYAIISNEKYSEELTKKKIEVVMEEVTPERILEGTVIVEAGDIISAEQYRKLKLVNLLNEESSSRAPIGLALFVAMVVSILYVYFYKWQISEEKKQNYVILLSLIFVLTLLLMKIFALLQVLDIMEVGYLFPAAMATMLIRLLLNERLSLIMSILLAVCGSIIFHESVAGSFNIEIAIYFLFSGLMGTIILSKQNQRLSILQTGIIVSLLNIIIIFFIVLLGSNPYENMNYLYLLLYAFGSGITSAVLTIGFLPFFEAGFGILSTMRLVELSNPNHPLLKRILTEAPGTYHHSVMVANLAEAACEAIGANGLLARVGCYYHDIGKTKRPHFFIENQMNGPNPHDRISPERSRDIIIAHAVDGGELLRKYKMPKEFIDIAEQHHGTTFLKFFYHKAKETRNEVKEDDYRYPGPKPQSKEIAVISIADSVEAAVRSMDHPTKEKIEKIVSSIIQDRLLDGQFNECDITLQELEIVKETLCNALNGIFHSRIEYPEDKKENDL